MQAVQQEIIMLLIIIIIIIIIIISFKFVENSNVIKRINFTSFFRQQRFSTCWFL